ncbi:hypothetical protein T492DRAFT_876623, partial [Pavlovales sp. CCMP2436]
MGGLATHARYARAPALRARSLLALALLGNARVLPGSCESGAVQRLASVARPRRNNATSGAHRALQHEPGEAHCSLVDVVRAMPPGSAELERYVTAVYGELADAAVRRRRLAWFEAYLLDEVDVLFESQLPRALRAARIFNRDPGGFSVVCKSLAARRELERAGVDTIMRA